VWIGLDELGCGCDTGCTSHFVYMYMNEIAVVPQEGAGSAQWVMVIVPNLSLCIAGRHPDCSRRARITRPSGRSNELDKHRGMSDRRNASAHHASRLPPRVPQERRSTSLRLPVRLWRLRTLRICRCRSEPTTTSSWRSRRAAEENARLEEASRVKDLLA